MWGTGPIWSNGACSNLCRFSVTPSATRNQIGPFQCCFPSGWVCVCSRPLWVSPTNSPVKLGVSLADASTPTGVFSQGFEALFPHAGTLGCEVCYPVHELLPHWPAAALPTLLHHLPPRSTICHLAGSASGCLAVSPLHPASSLHPSYWSG